MAVEPYIVELKGNSLDDGPGIRTVVFFKGCPLSCVWCHNPESMNIASELSFESKSCTDCGLCVPACPTGAASLKLPERINRELCETHFSCTQVCPSGALSAVGRKLSPEQLANELLKDRIFFEGVRRRCDPLRRRSRSLSGLCIAGTENSKRSRRSRFYWRPLAFLTFRGLNL